MNYSYYCKRCGYWSMSDDKQEIAKIEKVHRSDKRMIGRDSCGLYNFGDGTIARPDLIDILNKEVDG